MPTVITRLPRPGVIAAVCVFALTSVLLTLFVWRSVGGVIPLQAQKYEVQALFDNASSLTRNSDVRISGVNVGKVVKIKARGLKTEATLAIDEQYAPLPSDVRAILRQKTLLGESFVTISPGSRAAERLQDGSTIPVEQIGRTQPLDRVLGLLDKPTRENLKDLLTNTGAVLDGRGRDFSDTLGNLSIGSRQLAATVEILDGQRGMLAGVIRDTGRVLQTVGDHEASIQELIDSGNSALSATAGRAAALTATIEATPPLLRELRATSAAVERTTALAAPAVAGFRPLAPRVAPVLTAVRSASPELLAVLTDFDRLAPVAERGLVASSKFTRALLPLIDALEPAAEQIAPVTAFLAQYRKELIATMVNLRASTNGKSPGVLGGTPHYLRTLLPLGPEAFVGQNSRRPDNRHNAYRPPGGLAGLAGGLESADCRGASGPSSSAPACRQQQGWSHDGGPRRYFPHVEPAKP